MKRDMDLVRSILRTLEEHAHGWAPTKLSVEGFSEEQIGFHVMLIVDAGLAVGVDMTALTGTSPQWSASYLTWQGYEFLDAAKDETAWAKVKSVGSTVGGMAFEATKTLLMAYAVEHGKTLLGLPK